MFIRVYIYAFTRKLYWPILGGGEPEPGRECYAEQGAQSHRHRLHWGPLCCHVCLSPLEAEGAVDHSRRRRQPGQRQHHLRLGLRHDWRHLHMRVLGRRCYDLFGYRLSADHGSFINYDKVMCLRGTERRLSVLPRVSSPQADSFLVWALFHVQSPGLVPHQEAVDLEIEVHFYSFLLVSASCWEFSAVTMSTSIALLTTYRLWHMLLLSRGVLPR